MSSFISLSPITTIIACNKKDQVDDGSDSNRNVELLNQIKTEINKEFEQKESSVLDYKSFIGLSENDLFRILTDYYAKMLDNNSIEIDNKQITQYFINKINEKLRILNTRLKSQLAQLSNLPFDIVTISANNLFLEKLSYKQIIDVIKNLRQNSTNKYNNSSSKIFKLKFILSFKIRIDSIREEEYVFPEFQHFITDNISDISGKLSTISDSLHLKLQQSKISLEKILTENGELNRNLNQKFAESIKSNFNDKNPGLKLNFNSIPNSINEDDLKINLKSLKHTYPYGRDANDQLVQYYKNFINIILKNDENIIQSLYSNNEELKKINENRMPGSGLINIKEFNYIPLNLSVNDIKIPMTKLIKTYVTINYDVFIQYLKQFRTFFDEYFTLIKAGEVEYTHKASRKIVKIEKDSIYSFWTANTVKALEVDYKQVIFPKMKDQNKQYFKMDIEGRTYPWDLNAGIHYSNATIKFTFKIFTIKFLDDEQIRFIYK